MSQKNVSLVRMFGFIVKVLEIFVQVLFAIILDWKTSMMMKSETTVRYDVSISRKTQSRRFCGPNTEKEVNINRFKKQ